MEKLIEVLIRMESSDAVEIANKFIVFKYVEFFTTTLVAIGIVVVIIFGIRFYIEKMD